MEQLESPPDAPKRDRWRDVRATLVAAGAALGMTLAGLGIAAAQTDGGSSGSTTAAPAEPGAKESEGAIVAGHRAFGGGCGVKAHLGAAAEAIGISETELMTALRSGQSLAQVAESKDVDVKKVVEALVADAKANVAARVEAGDLTQAQADAKLADLDERITAMVNRAGFIGRAFGRPGRHRHHLPPPPAAEGTSVETAV